MRTFILTLELLPYCRVGNGSEVSVWDLDDITIYGGCISPLKEETIIDGFVFNRSNVAMPNISVELSTDPLFTNKRTVKTDAEGYYFFTPVERGASYYVRGYKNDDILNGVNVVDLVLIQKHLLGLEPFTSLQQFVAADINRSGIVSVMDLVDLRKLLLGIHAEFPRNTSWRFGLLLQDFSTSDISHFQEVKFIESQEADVHDVNFIGIKTGDLNGDARND